MNYDDTLSAVVTLTQQMLDAAGADDWDLVIQIEERRILMLNSMEKFGAEAVTADNALDRLQVLVELNKSLLELGETKKMECFRQFSSGKKNIKAFNAYTGY